MFVCFFCYLFYHSRSSWSSENAADYKNREKKGTVSFRYIRQNKMSICVFNYNFHLIYSDEIQLAHIIILICVISLHA